MVLFIAATNTFFLFSLFPDFSSKLQSEQNNYHSTVSFVNLQTNYII